MKQCLYLLIVLLIGCQNGNKKRDSLNAPKKEFFKIDTLDHALLNKRVEFKEDKALEKANLILSNDIYVWDLWEPVSYDREINWEIDPYQNSSWKLYFQSLRMVGVLARAYEFDPNIKYLQKAMEIISSWDSFQSSKGTSKEIWSDHMTANRTLNLTHLLFVGYDKLSENQIESIFNIINLHGKWLNNDKNYTKGNHAIMQDRALMQTALIFNFDKSEVWYAKSLQRVLSTFDKEITSEGVCVENSPAYHPYVMDLLNNFIVMGENFEKPLPKKYKETFNKMKSFLVYIIKPNNKFPQFGDTYYSQHPLSLSEKYDSPELLYLETQGAQGISPKNLDKVYPESGYAIFRDRWGLGEDFSKTSYFAFINTNQSKVHKHADYLSFEFYSNGEELIVDPGHMGYEKDDLSEYLRTTTAHNVMTTDFKNYDIRKIPLYNSAQIVDFEIKDLYSMVQGIFDDQNGLVYNRKVYFIKPNVLVLYDQIESKTNLKPNNIQQIFNFGRTLKSTRRISQNHYVSNFMNNKLHILQHNPVDKVSEFNGEVSKRGYIANGALKYRKGTQIIFEKKVQDKKNHFVTMLYVENNLLNKIDLNTIKIENQENSYSIQWGQNENNIIKINF